MEGAEAMELAPSYLDLPDKGDDHVIVRFGCYIPYIGHLVSL